MRTVSLVLVVLSLSPVVAQEGGGENRSRAEQKRPESMEEMVAMLQAQIEQQDKVWAPAPATLTEAHERLEKILSAKTLAEIDAMASEDEMIKYHFSLGLNIRNGWGLWGDSALAQHMKELGFPHPDYMSGVILETFWCKRHGRGFELAERAADCQREWEESVNRLPKARAALRERMMGLRFEKRDVPVVPINVRRVGVKTRFLCPFRNGVFLTAYHRGRLDAAHVPMQPSYVDTDGNGRPGPEYDDFVHRGYGFNRTEHNIRKMRPGEDSYTQGYYFDPRDCKLHRICVPEVDEVYAAVVAGGRAWFGGLSDSRKLVVTGVGAQDRITVPLPQTDEMPDLGVDGQSLLAVYRKTIYRLEDKTWTIVPSGGVLLPRSELAPLRHGDTVYLRSDDEFHGRRYNRLWWLTLGEEPHLSVLDRRLRTIAEEGGPQLDEVTSYCVMSDGDLWVCVGDHYLANCLLRLSQDGEYAIAILGSSVRFLEDGWPVQRHSFQDAMVTAVTALRDDALLLAGRTGLYYLEDNELAQELAFTLPRPAENILKTVRHRNWNPNNVLLLDDGSYFITTDTWEGAYWIRQDDAGQWTSLSIDEGDPVIW